MAKGCRLCRFWAMAAGGDGAKGVSTSGQPVCGLMFRQTSRLKPQKSGTMTSIPDGDETSESNSSVPKRSKKHDLYWTEGGKNALMKVCMKLIDAGLISNHDVHQQTMSGPSTLLQGTVLDKTISPLNDVVFWSFASVQATGGTVGVATATVRLVSADGVGVATATVRLVSADGEEKIASSDGTCSVTAAYKAINQIIKIPNVIVREKRTNITGSGIAITRVVVAVTGDASNSAAIHALAGKSSSGSGEARDFVVSNVIAYLDALNKICSSIISSWIDINARSDDELQALKEENARLKKEKADEQAQNARIKKDNARIKEEKATELQALIEENTRLKEEKKCWSAWYEDVCRAITVLQSAPECIHGPRPPTGNVLQEGSGPSTMDL